MHDMGDSEGNTAGDFRPNSGVNGVGSGVGSRRNQQSPKTGGVLTSTSRPPAQDGLHHSLFRFREGSYEALNRLEHDSPLRFGLQHAEDFEFTFHLRRNPKTKLRVIRHLLAGTSAGRRPSAAVARSSISSSHTVLP